MLSHDRLRYESYVVIEIYGYKIEQLWVQGVIYGFKGLKGYKIF